MGLYMHLLNQTKPREESRSQADALIAPWARRQRMLLGRYLALTRPRRGRLMSWWRRRSGCAAAGAQRPAE
ncbi:hypothetical protein THUN1379_31490 [Paludibacterium sp. THUN1379]|nr:hypothetical protein THUN1379_31490 [Paludibacterium sp. THUN1379]